MIRIRSLGHILSLLLLVGCSTPPPTPVDPDMGGRQYVPAGASPGSIAEFNGADGQTLGYVHYHGDARVALVYLHGIESHAGWFALTAQRLADKGYDVYCLDRRGSGINRENRNLVSGHVDHYEVLFEDLASFLQLLRERYSRIFLVGLSWGGKLGLAYALEKPHDIDGLVMITPGIAALVDVSFAQKLKILALNLLAPTSGVELPIEAEMFSTTPEFLKYIREDPLRLKSASAAFLYQSHRLDKLVERKIDGHRVAMLLFLAGQDRIIDNPGVEQLLARGSAGGLAIREYADQTHSIQLDAPDRLTHDIDDWLQRQLTEVGHRP